MNKSTLSKTMVIMATTFLLAFAPVMGNVSSVSADDGTTDPTPGPRKILTTQQVELRYQNQLLILQKMELGIEKVESGFPKLTEKLTKLKEKGIDVSAVEAKLAAFSSAVAANKNHYEQAKVLLNTHNGFDSNGKVTNLESAHATLKAVRAEFKAYRDGIKEAAKAFREAVKSLREKQANTAV